MYRPAQSGNSFLKEGYSYFSSAGVAAGSMQSGMWDFSETMFPKGNLYIPENRISGQERILRSKKRQHISL